MITSQDHHRVITRYRNSSPLYINLTKFIFFYLLNMSIQAQDLVYSNFFGNFIYQNDWIIQPVCEYSTAQKMCGSSKIFGQHCGATQIIKSIELPPHSTLSLNFKFWSIDYWNGEKLEVVVDNLLVYSGIYNSRYNQDICSASGHSYASSYSYGDGVNLVNINIDHVNQIAKIKIIGQQYYWGISEFQVWTISQDCQDQNKDPFDGCFSGRYDCVQGCTNCIRGICIGCQRGWEYNILTQTCFPICGDQMIISFEECDDGNELEYDSCFKCRFSCPLFCRQCEFGKCLECQSNYYLIDKRCKEMNGSQDQKQQDNFSIQISNFLDYGNYGKVKK